MKYNHQIFSMSKSKIFLLLLLIVNISFLSAQQKLIIHGYVFSEDHFPLEFVNVAVLGSHEGTVTDSTGKFSFTTSQKLPITVRFSSVGYAPVENKLFQLGDVTKPLRIFMSKTDENIDEVNILGKTQQDQSMTFIDPNLATTVPDATGGTVEGLVKTQIGVTSNNELSSAYRVRGGNYDENLVYVNDIEIYRPFLVRSGQQEGLSFTNPNMVSSLKFSPGGFNASYGDKMSSVLDIKYKKPIKYAGSVQASLLGVSGHLEGITKNKKFTHITGARYKTNQYLLGSLDTQGDYSPRFIDIQSYLTYQLNDKWSTELIAYFSQNEYNFKPTTRETSFGTISEIKQLMVYFEGQEKDLFQTGFGALSVNFTPNSDNLIKFTTSAFKTYEEETYDILGEYLINELDPLSGEPVNPTDPVTNIGVGGFLQHARNDLLGQVYNFSLHGTHQLEKHSLSWEQKVQIEKFDDHLNEWEMRDSAGYSLPKTETAVALSNVYNADLSVYSTRISGYLMDNVSIQLPKGTMFLNFGLRYNYWDFNNEILVSPRINATYIPENKNNIHYRFATGFYFQPPFYKELRTPEGELNDHIRAQKSLHIVGATDIYFDAWDRPFKFTTEAYYKKMTDLISYQVDNVRIRYSGQNDAKGYAAGLDFKINGEFVDGVESWASLGILKTEEDLINDSYVKTDSEGTEKTYYPGYIPRPSDQRLNFAMFFQDYLPKYPTFKVHLNLLFSTGLPFGPPKSPRYLATFRTPPYRRADIGFSKDLTKNRINSTHLFKQLSIGMEIFNLFNISNTISYYWVTDVNNRQYAVPNYLTARRLNFNIKAQF